MTPLTHPLTHWPTDSTNYKEMLSHLKNALVEQTLVVLSNVESHSKMCFIFENLFGFSWEARKQQILQHVH